MGGTTSVVQARSFINDRVSNVVQETLTSKSTVVSTSVGASQIMENITVRPPPAGYCPANQPPGAFNMNQSMDVYNSVGLSLTMVNTSELADKVLQDLQDAVNNAINIEKKDSLAFTDNTNTNQTLTWSSSTRSNVRSTIETKLETFVQTVTVGDQIKRNVTVYTGCGDFNFNQTSTTRVIATDFASAITETILQSDEVQKFVTASDTSTTQKATGTVAALGDNIEDIVTDVAGTAIGGLTSITYVIIGAIVLVLIVAAVFLYKFFNSDGGKQMVKSAETAATRGKP